MAHARDERISSSKAKMYQMREVSRFIEQLALLDTSMSGRLRAPKKGERICSLVS